MSALIFICCFNLACLLFTVFLHYSLTSNLFSASSLVSQFNFFLNGLLISIFIVDVLSTTSENCKIMDKNCSSNENFMIDKPNRYILLKFSYFFLAINSHLCIPLMKGYTKSGGFTFKAKIWDSIVDNLQYYVILISVIIVTALILYFIDETEVFSFQFVEILVQICILFGFFLSTLIIAHAISEIHVSLLRYFHPRLYIREHLQKFDMYHTQLILDCDELEKYVTNLLTMLQANKDSEEIKKINSILSQVPQHLIKPVDKLNQRHGFFKEMPLEKINLEVKNLISQYKFLSSKVSFFTNLLSQIPPSEFDTFFMNPNLSYYRRAKNHFLEVDNKTKAYLVQIHAFSLFAILFTFLTIFTFVTAGFRSWIVSPFQKLFIITNFSWKILVCLIGILIGCFIFTLIDFEIYGYYMVSIAKSTPDHSLLHLTRYISMVTPNICFMIIIMLHFDPKLSKTVQSTTEFNTLMGSFNGTSIVLNYTSIFLPFMVVMILIGFYLDIKKNIFTKLMIIETKDWTEIFNNFKTYSEQKQVDQV